MRAIETREPEFVMLALLVVMILFGRTLMTSAEWHIATVATQGASSAFFRTSASGALALQFDAFGLDLV